MKIKRRNRSELSIAFVTILFVVLPFTFFSSFVSTGSISHFIIIGVGVLLFMYYMKQYQLSKVEVEYIKDKADSVVTWKKTDRGNYAILIIFIFNLFIIDPAVERFSFGLNLLSILFFLGLFIYQEVNNKNSSLEQLFFLREQIVYIGGRQKVVNISDIEGLYLKETNLYIREKYGVLEFNTEKLQEAEKQKLKLKIIELSKELTIGSDFINISI